MSARPVGDLPVLVEPDMQGFGSSSVYIARDPHSSFVYLGITWQGHIHWRTPGEWAALAARYTGPGVPLNHPAALALVERSEP
jgi:hypothetical protein